MASAFSVLLFATILYFLSVSNVHLVIASTRGSYNDDKCKEVPVNCSATFTYEFRDPGDGYMYARVEYSIDPSYNVCSLDALGPLSNLSSTIKCMAFIQCERPGTRVAITSGDNYNISVTMLTVKNCSMHWEDISLIGQNGNLELLGLYDWEDEFTSWEPTHFTSCMQQYSGADMTIEGPKHVIPGMSNVNEIRMRNIDLQPMSPAFIIYLWPVVQAFSCVR